MPPKPQIPRWRQAFDDEGRKLAVAYVRVSTDMQRADGYGAEAQRSDIRRFASTHRYTVVEWFTDVKSGKDIDAFERRPQLKAAFSMALDLGCTVIAAKVDRLSRNVAFVSRVLETHPVHFVTAQTGDRADKTMIHLYAMMAEKERAMISERTRAAMERMRSNGAPIGCPKGLKRKNAHRNERLTTEAKERAEKYYPMIHEFRCKGNTFQQISNALTRMNIATKSGVPWTANNVERCYARSAKMLGLPSSESGSETG